MASVQQGHYGELHDDESILDDDLIDADNDGEPLPLDPISLIQC
jgi:hypothetical protein